MTDPLVVRRIKRSHDRLGLDRETTMEVAYPLFLEKFEATAAEYGETFRREFTSRINYRIGRYYLANGEYGAARRHLLRAAVASPSTTDYLKYAVASLGGPLTYGIARRLTGDGDGTESEEATDDSFPVAELVERHDAARPLVTGPHST